MYRGVSAYITSDLLKACLFAFHSLMRKAARRRQGKTVSRSSLLMFRCPHSRRLRRHLYGGRKWNCCRNMQVRLCRHRVKKPSDSWGTRLSQSPS